MSRLLEPDVPGGPEYDDETNEQRAQRMSEAGCSMRFIMEHLLTRQFDKEFDQKYIKPEYRHLKLGWQSEDDYHTRPTLTGTYSDQVNDAR